MKSKEISKNNPRATCEKVLARLIPEPDKYQPGKSKIFFRAGQVIIVVIIFQFFISSIPSVIVYNWCLMVMQVAYLEKLRADKLRACAIMVQKHIKGWLQKKVYRKKRNAAIVLQRYSRGMQARRLVILILM